MDADNDDPLEMIDEVDMDEDERINIRMFVQMQIINHAQMQIINHAQQELERRQSIGAVVLLCHVTHALHLLELLSTSLHSRVNDVSPPREHRRRELMSYLVHTQKCQDIIRMGPQAFLQLCQKLRGTGVVKDNMHSTVEEQVAKFLHIIGHNVKNRTTSFFFHHFGDIVSHHFQNVLDAIIFLGEEFLVQPSGRDVPPQILNDSKFYPFFKDCIGAIDGTHIQVKVPRAEARRYRRRKGYTTQNVFAACDFNMKFTYVLAGWEGSASDSRILEDALSREDPLKIPEGKFYIGDAGFRLKRGILTPYRGVRYHVKEFSACNPQNCRELFNQRHYSLRNVIERTFGVLKKRFPILSGDSKPYYSVETMRDIVLACCILHNFLMEVDVDESLIAEVDHELLQHDIDRSRTKRDEDHREGALLRDNIAAEMWSAYQI